MAPKKGVRNKLVAKLVTEPKLPCAFCRRLIDDEVALGKLYEIGNIQCHYFCALLSSCLIQKGKDEVGLLGFLYEDILAEVERSKKHRCSFCGVGGATLGCAVTQCKKQFHLPCGRERHTVSLFYGNYKSYCQLHAPKQNVPAKILASAKLRMAGGSKRAKHDKNLKELCSSENKTENEVSMLESVCVICYEPVDGFPTTETFWPPCCGRDAWFHRTCLERMSLSAGMHYLKCPLCNDKQNFYEAVVKQGYYVPDRDAAWELEQNAFSEIYERTLSCGATHCACPGGPTLDDEHGPWDIKLCLLCGSVGIHVQCRANEMALTAEPDSVYVCHICRPAAPEDLETLAISIEAVIQSEEQSRAAALVQRGPRMPSRMSLRRTKGSLYTSSTSQNVHETGTGKLSNSTPSINSSREDLNLKTPKRPEGLIRPQIKPTVLKLSPKRSPFKQITSPYKHTSSPYKHTVSPYKHMKSPLKSIENNSPDEFMFSPMKLLEDTLRKRGRNNVVISEELIEKLRRKFKRPKPMSKKKKIISDILDNLILNEVPKDVETHSENKETVQTLYSPKKELIGNEELQDSTADIQVGRQSPKQQEPRIEPDDSDASSDTFELPPEFIAESSNDDFPIISTPSKLKTVDIEKDSSLEISENDEVINIDVIKMAAQDGGDKMADASKIEFLKKLDLKSPIKNKKVAFKFNPYNKEELENDNVDIDLESFKNRYLNEVAPEKPVTETVSVEKKLRGRRKRKRDEKIVLQYETKSKKDKSNRNLFIRNKEIKVKIKWRRERLKLKITDSKHKKTKNVKDKIKQHRDKNKQHKYKTKQNKDKTKQYKDKTTETEDTKNKSFTQYILKYSPNESSIVKPEFEVTPAKRKYIKQEKSPDNLVQTSLDRFFKLKPHKE